MKLYITLLFAFLLAFSGLQYSYAGQSVTTDTVFLKLESKSYKDIIKLFNEIGYTSERWQKGIREVPRIRITNIPKRWQTISPTIPVKDKKNIFFRLIGSGILIANEKISQTHERLLTEIDKKNISQNEWIHVLAMRYKVIKKKDSLLDKNKINELLQRVDAVPPSLALAQGAIESGWGTSRFAIKGNSLFGQWDFSGNGIKPKKQRTKLGNYGIAAYDNPQASIDAYMLNLNTHLAYKRLRDMRTKLHKQNKPQSGWELAKTLDKYSERGNEYIKELHNIMRYNKLNAADEAFLWDKGEIIISPAP